MQKSWPCGPFQEVCVPFEAASPATDRAGQVGLSSWRPLIRSLADCVEYLEAFVMAVGELTVVNDVLD